MDVLSYTASSTYILPRLLGHSKATALLLTGGTFHPSSPYLQGLYHSILPTREEVLPAALALAHELAINTSQTAVGVHEGVIVARRGQRRGAAFVGFEGVCGAYGGEGCEGRGEGVCGEEGAEV